MSFVYLVLAAFGLGFLVFIHELGHYFVARRKGMKVEAFGIGFGRPFRTWEHKGVKWNLCWLPFGGYVKIAGMEKQGKREPHQIAGGFFSKKPWARIQVLLAGPFVNILFALVAFALLWMMGGRVKPFSEFTHRIGWLEEDSQLYSQGVRIGDEIVRYDGRPFQGFNDLLYASFLDEQPGELVGYEIDYWNEIRKPFSSVIDPTRDLQGFNPRARALGILGPASYLIFERFVDDSPMRASGIERGDRILWADGELVFSQAHLTDVINQPHTLLTLKRNGRTLVSRVPRVLVRDLRIEGADRAELDDWQHEAGLCARVDDLYFIPYNLNSRGVVESPLTYMGEDAELHTFEAKPRAPLALPLRPGDQVVAVDGRRVESAYELMRALQERHIQIIVQREAERPPRPLWKDADSLFDRPIDWKAFEEMVFSIGTAHPIEESGTLRLLKPVAPRPHFQYASVPERVDAYQEKLEKERKAIESMEDPKARAEARRAFEQAQHKLKLGAILYDRGVIYNPPPTTLFVDVFRDTGRTLKALATGYLNPKWLQGPVGIVQVIHHGWSIGAKEALFWLGMISLNLGILNLLPIPMLDGGYICFCLYEWITGKRIKAKTMERLIIPFLVLIIIFFLYVTYNDVSRLFHRFF